jgi:hypothetical protein
VDRVIDQVLERHEPYPAWVVKQPFTFPRANRAADALFPGLTGLPAEALIDLWFGPGPFRDSVQNWPDVLSAGLAALRRDAAATGDPTVIALLHRAESVAGQPSTRPDSSPVAGHSPVVCPVFTFDGRTVASISAVMRFDTAVEVTTSTLRIELMFPADDEAATFFHDLAR